MRSSNVTGSLDPFSVLSYKFILREKTESIPNYLSPCFGLFLQNGRVGVGQDVTCYTFSHAVPLCHPSKDTLLNQSTMGFASSVPLLYPIQYLAPRTQE